ncbi:hypothetical protein BJ508DRAFT_69096 [Ascobolus immersus RN42]|uniref:Uncharacterized protein n=1 Tax=Ascobolus immersus RN42 TaxID=1160509 RepID=A0A3N4HEJ1_ASCIM|nr:hypothetical protein BJ508DRAFT_69096 [Ascobolus immersus RN42]
MPWALVCMVLDCKLDLRTTSKGFLISLLIYRIGNSGSFVSTASGCFFKASDQSTSCLSTYAPPLWIVRQHEFKAAIDSFVYTYHVRGSVSICMDLCTRGGFAAFLVQQMGPSIPMLSDHDYPVICWCPTDNLDGPIDAHSPITTQFSRFICGWIKTLRHKLGLGYMCLPPFVPQACFLTKRNHMRRVYIRLLARGCMLDPDLLGVGRL